uniref:hypothetical protein n=1 Tax=Gemmiger formicilis TaxID=745368 RepID=UPI0040291780
MGAQLAADLPQAPHRTEKQNSRRVKTRATKIAATAKAMIAAWERQLAAGRGDKITARYKRERQGKRNS